MNPSVQYGLWVITSQGSLIIYNKCTTLVGDINLKNCGCIKAWSICMGNLCIFCQYCCEPKTVLKNKMVKIDKNPKKEIQQPKRLTTLLSNGQAEERCILKLIQTHTQTIFKCQRGKNVVPCISRQSMLLFNKMYHSTFCFILIVLMKYIISIRNPGRSSKLNLLLANLI